MRMNIKSKLGYIIIACIVLMLASCGNSNKKNVDQKTQPQDSAVIIEEESIVVIDSIAPDTLKK